ncbi:unnamed protein product [Diamesa hyperborea]
MRFAEIIGLCVIFSFIHDVTAIQVNCIYGSYTDNPKTAECLSVGLNIAETGVNLDNSMGTLRPGYEVTKISVINQIVKYLPVGYNKFPYLNSILVQDSEQQFILKTDFKNLPKLKELRLKIGQIKEVHEDTFKITPELEVLSIESQKITILPVALLQGLKMLKTVSFYGNQIDVLDAALFKDNKMLISVDFDSNHLSIIGATLLDQLTVLEAVSFFNNPCIFMSSVTSSVQAVRNAINSDVCKSAGSSGVIAASPKVESKDTTIAKLTGFVNACEMKLSACPDCDTIKSKYEAEIAKLKSDNAVTQTELKTCKSMTDPNSAKCSENLTIMTKNAETCKTDADAAKLKCDATAASNDVAIKKCNLDISKATKDCSARIAKTKQQLAECYKQSAFSKL